MRVGCLKKTTKVEILISANQMRILVYRDGRFKVITPKGLDTNVIKENIKNNIEWINKKKELFRKIERNLPSKRFYMHYREETREIVSTRMNYFNKSYNFNFNEIIVGDLKNRWGFCSKDGRISFDYRVALLPKRMVNYIIVHELCHLAVLNHTKRFWDLVKKTIPDCKEVNELIANY